MGKVAFVCGKVAIVLGKVASVKSEVSIVLVQVAFVFGNVTIVFDATAIVLGEVFTIASGVIGKLLKFSALPVIVPPFAAISSEIATENTSLIN